MELTNEAKMEVPYWKNSKDNIFCLNLSILPQIMNIFVYFCSDKK